MKSAAENSIARNDTPKQYIKNAITDYFVMFPRKKSYKAVLKNAIIYAVDFCRCTLPALLPDAPSL
jgi:hypothetical protein